MGTNATRHADETMADATGEVSITDLQQEPHQYAITVPVSLDGPVQTQAMPCQQTTSRTVTLDIAGAMSVAKTDLRRSTIYLVAEGNPVYIGCDPGQVSQGTAGTLPVGQVLPWPGTREVFARAAAGLAGETTLSLFIHQWST